MLQDDPDNDLYYCRTCTSITTKTVSIFSSNNSSETSYNKIVESVLSIKVDENDSMPQRICLHCAEMLFTINDFVQKATAAETELRKYYSSFTSYKNEVDNVNDDASDSGCLPLIHAVNNSNKTSPEIEEPAQAKNINGDLDKYTQRSTSNEKTASKKSSSLHKKNNLCVICLKRVTNLRSHIKKHDLQNNLLIRYCPLCGLGDESLELVCSHIFYHFNINSSLEIHNKFQCSICSCIENNLHSYLLHIATHIPFNNEERPTSLYCVTCGKQILNSTFQRHLRHHSIKKNFECPHCGRIYAQESGMTRHIRMTHEGIRKYKCPTCAVIFISNEKLRNHQKLHDDPRPFQCDTCGRTFFTQKHLYHHTQYHHTENGLRVSCEVCSRVFSSASVLRRHYKTVHLKQKDFQCHVCSVQLSTKQYLKEHLRTHTEERPYVCLVCKKTFQVAGNLRQHMKTHMERAQVCDVCGRRFARRCHLLVHMGCHQGIPSPVCQICGKEFLLKADLLKHSIEHA